MGVLLGDSVDEEEVGGTGSRLSRKRKREREREREEIIYTVHRAKLRNIHLQMKSIMANNNYLPATMTPAAPAFCALRACNEV